MLPLLKIKNLKVHNVVEKELNKISEKLKRKIYGFMLSVGSGKILKMPASRPMPSIAKGVHELRVKDESGKYRIFYYTKLKNDILIFHFFKKKTQATPKKEIDLAKKRLETMKGKYL